MADTAADIDPLVERILSEGRLSMAAAARKLGTHRQGKPAHPATVTRWAVAGVPAPGGVVVRLEAIRFNGALATSWPAVLRFFSAQQQTRPDGSGAGTGPRSPGQRVRAAEAAGKELRKLGC